jgi:hypothetical protein
MILHTSIYTHLLKGKQAKDYAIREARTAAEACKGNCSSLDPLSFRLGSYYS